MKSRAISPPEAPFFARISENISKPKNWKLGVTILAGKMIGLLLVVFAMMILPGMLGTEAMAAETYTPHETAVINTINTLWTLVAAFLVSQLE